MSTFSVLPAQGSGRNESLPNAVTPVGVVLHLHAGHLWEALAAMVLMELFRRQAELSGRTNQ